MSNLELTDAQISVLKVFDDAQCWQEKPEAGFIIWFKGDPGIGFILGNGRTAQEAWESASLHISTPSRKGIVSRLLLAQNGTVAGITRTLISTYPPDQLDEFFQAVVTAAIDEGLCEA